MAFQASVSSKLRHHSIQMLEMPCGLIPFAETKLTSITGFLTLEAVP